MLLVCGVSGSGKSTLASNLAEAIPKGRFIEADVYHSSYNKEKMASGQPLSDADRLPWLMAVASASQSCLENGNVPVVACSALKNAYREMLGPNLTAMLYSNDRELLCQRLENRRGHFLGGSQILDSQIATLEMPEESNCVILVNCALTIGQQKDLVMKKVAESCLL